MIYAALAYLVIGLHYAFLLYVVIGGFVAWRWPRTVVVHVAAAVWGLLIVTAHLLCPLTWAQNELRRLAGQHGGTHSFINSYVRGVFYPAHEQLATQASVAVVVLVSWLGLALRVRARRRDAAAVGSPPSGPGELGRPGQGDREHATREHGDHVMGGATRSGA